MAALAVAYAECGDFDRAISYQRKVLEFVSDGNRKEAEERLELFKSRKPYRVQVNQLLAKQ